jgi:hypothetical protein
MEAATHVGLSGRGVARHRGRTESAGCSLNKPKIDSIIDVCRCGKNVHRPVGLGVVPAVRRPDISVSHPSSSEKMYETTLSTGLCVSGGLKETDS